MNNHHQGSSNRSAQRALRRAGGFTMIELLVVLSIMALVTSITVGTFKSLGDSNQRTGCQTNLTQIYQGLRLYMADETYAPPFNPTPATGGKKNIGLWNLWTFPDKTDADKIAKVGQEPTARYIRSTNVLHCPSDSEPGTLRVNPADLYTDALKENYNPDFLSYQIYATDETFSSQDTATGTDNNRWTYLPSRTDVVANAGFKRQLNQLPSGATQFLRRPPADNTVVTWCRHHRHVRDFDNVLFFDGSVQLLRKEQDEFGPSPNCNVTGVLTGANRVHRRIDCDE